MVCNEDGSWSNLPPKCRRISCGPPDLPDNSMVSGNDYLYGGVVTFKCREGYELKVSLTSH